MVFVRALAFGLAPERFFVLAFAAVDDFLAPPALSARPAAPFFAVDVALDDFRFAVGFTAFDDSATLLRPLDRTPRSAASSALRALIAATRALVALEARELLAVRISV